MNEETDNEHFPLLSLPDEIILEVISNTNFVTLLSLKSCCSRLRRLVDSSKLEFKEKDWWNRLVTKSIEQGMRLVTIELDNSNLKFIQSYKGKKLNGRREFRIGDKISEISHFKDDMLNGLYYRYHLDGELWSVTHHIDGASHGIYYVNYGEPIFGIAAGDEGCQSRRDLSDVLYSCKDENHEECRHAEFVKLHSDCLSPLVI